MQISRKNQWIIFSCVNGAVLFIIALFPFYLALAKVLPIGKCGLVSLAGLYCPACGGTRALDLLLRFDILGSIKYNPIVITLALAFVGYDVFMAFHLIKGKPRGLFIKPKTAYIVLAVWLIYSIMRNVLLIFGIDVIGDIL